jgi:hypothetical protein
MTSPVRPGRPGRPSRRDSATGAPPGRQAPGPPRASGGLPGPRPCPLLRPTERAPPPPANIRGMRPSGWLSELLKAPRPLRGEGGSTHPPARRRRRAGSRIDSRTRDPFPKVAVAHRGIKGTGGRMTAPPRPGGKEPRKVLKKQPGGQVPPWRLRTAGLRRRAPCLWLSRPEGRARARAPAEAFITGAGSPPAPALQPDRCQGLRDAEYAPRGAADLRRTRRPRRGPRARTVPRAS